MPPGGDSLLEFEQGYVRRFFVPADMARHPDWVELLRERWNLRYPDLYDAPRPGERTARLEETLQVIVGKLQGEGGTEGHRRVVWLAFIMAKAVLPMLAATLRTQEPMRGMLVLLQSWLEGGAVSPAALQALAAVVPRATGSLAGNEGSDFFRQLPAVLALDAALDVVTSLSEDCLEGYAIFPGASDERRDLFNWWLLHAVPAAFSGRVPALLYTMELPWPPVS